MGAGGIKLLNQFGAERQRAHDRRRCEFIKPSGKFGAAKLRQSLAESDMVYLRGGQLARRPFPTPGAIWSRQAASGGYARTRTAFRLRGPAGPVLRRLNGSSGALSARLSVACAFPPPPRLKSVTMPVAPCSSLMGMAPGVSGRPLTLADRKSLHFQTLRGYSIPQVSQRAVFAGNGMGVARQPASPDSAVVQRERRQHGCRQARVQGRVGEVLCVPDA